MRLRNDSGAPLHIPPTDAGPSVLVADGEEIDYPVHVAGLTPIEDPTAAPTGDQSEPAPSPKGSTAKGSTAKPKTDGAEPTEGVSA